jgi:hypothetical protein
LLVYKDTGFILWYPGCERRQEAVVNDPFGGGDLRCLRITQRRLPAILAASGGSLQLATPADQHVRGAVVLKLWLGRAFQFRNDPLGKCFA